MNDEPLVSVIIPAYDRPHLIADAIRNVRNQTYTNIELIVVDDCSPKPVSKILQDELGDDHQIIIIRHGENKGANAARNTGVKRANGKYIAFLDDDDRWFSEKIGRQVARLESCSQNTTIAYTGKVYVNEEGVVQGVTTHRVSEPVVRELLMKNQIGSFSTLLIHKKVFDTVGDLDESLPCWQDTDFLIRAAQNFDLICISKPLTLRVFHGDQITSDFHARTNIALPHFLENHSLLAEKYEDRFKDKMLSHRMFNVGWNGIRNGHHRESWPYILKAIKHNPLWIRPYIVLLACIFGEPMTKILIYINNILTTNDERVGDEIIIEDGQLSIQDSHSSKWDIVQNEQAPQ